MNSKNYVQILKFGIYASFACFLFVFSGLLFPYITSKQIAFNILMEALLPLWVILVVKYKDWRPKMSWITWGVLAYFTAILISCFLGVDFNLSFWGNAERMLGFFHLAHFLIFYLIVITVFKKKEDFTRLIDVSLLVSAVIVIYSFVKDYPASTIGNTAYVAAVMIFSTFFSMWRIYQTKKTPWLYLYIVSLLVSLVGFVRSDISGAQAGLAAGLFAFCFLLVILSKNRKLKIYGSSAMGLAVIALVLLFAFRWAPVFDNSKIGQSLRDFSDKNVTWNTRVLSWTSAYLDFHNHPFFGTGYGNYAYTFDKYFNPKFFDYSRNESYFDRAHNNLIDITSTTGIIGLLAYLSIFIAVAFYLIKAYREDRLPLFDFALLVGLFTAYFVQNLAVFDSLVTYILIFSVLGMVYNLQPEAGICKWGGIASKLCANFYNKTAKAKGDQLEKIPTFLLVIIVGGFSLYTITAINIRGLNMLSGVIQGYVKITSGYIEDGFDIFKASLENPAPFNRDSRSNLVTLIGQNARALQYVDATKRDEILKYLVATSEKNVAYNPKDSLMNSQLAQILTVAAGYTSDVKVATAYANESLEAINRSIDASPGRIPVRFVKASILFMFDRKDDVLATLREARDLKLDFADSHCQLANMDFYYSVNKDETLTELGDCARYGGSKLISNPDLLKQGIDYYRNQENNIAQKLQEQLVSLQAQAAATASSSSDGQ